MHACSHSHVYIELPEHTLQAKRCSAAPSMPCHQAGASPGDRLHLSIPSALHRLAWGANQLRCVTIIFCNFTRASG